MGKDPRSAVQLDIAGIKCDTRGCGWRDDTAKRADYAEWLTRRCPRCNGRLLTEADLAAVLRIERMVAWVNRWFSWLPKRRNPTAYELKMDGTGKVSPERKP